MGWDDWKQKRLFFPETDDRQEMMNVFLSDLFFLTELSKNETGRTMLVKCQKKKRLFMLKIIEKSHCTDDLALRSMVINEKMTLEKCNHPFIVKGYKTFKEKNTIYYLMEYFHFVRLSDALKEIGMLSNFQVLFYSASIILAIEYLHFHNILHRDIRPDSFILGQDGYGKLTNFTHSTHLSPTHRFRTYTVIGTPHYMAPELHTNQGYSYSSDLWSLGIFIYELICAKYPFGHDFVDPFEIYEAVENGELTFPAYFSSHPANMACRDLLCKLLVKEPEKRIGADNFVVLKAHEWFDGINWVSLSYH